MDQQTIVGLVAIAVTLILAGAAWMFRIDRLLTRVDTRMDSFADDHEELRQTVKDHSREINEVKQRVTRLEPKRA